MKPVYCLIDPIENDIQGYIFSNSLVELKDIFSSLTKYPYSDRRDKCVEYLETMGSHVEPGKYTTDGGYIIVVGTLN